MKAVLQTHVGRVAAWLEVIVGLSLMSVPRRVCGLIFGSILAGAGVPMARLAGIGLLSLGVAYFAVRNVAPARAAGSGLLVFNAVTAVLLAYVGAFTELHGPLLWPAVILHTAIAAGLLIAASSLAHAAR